MYVSFVLQTVGLQYTTPSKNAFLTAVNAVIVPFIGFLLYKRKVDLFELSGADSCCNYYIGNEIRVFEEGEN